MPRIVGLVADQLGESALLFALWAMGASFFAPTVWFGGASRADMRGWGHLGGT